MEAQGDSENISLEEDLYESRRSDKSLEDESPEDVENTQVEESQVGNTQLMPIPTATMNTITREELYSDLKDALAPHGYTVEAFLATPIDDLGDGFDGESRYALRDLWLMSKGLF